MALYVLTVGLLSTVNGGSFFGSCGILCRVLTFICWLVSLSFRLIVLSIILARCWVLHLPEIDKKTSLRFELRAFI